MLPNNLPETGKDIFIENSPVEIFFDNEGATPLAICISPLDDILEMKQLEKSHFSLSEHVSKIDDQYKQHFEYELKILEEKFNKYSKSSVYLNRLANFAELSDQREIEEKFLVLAKKLSNDPFFDHRLGDNLINRNQLPIAEKLFSELDLNNDLFANLRLAFFSIRRMDFTAASAYVKNALNIDSLDYRARFLEGALRIIEGNYELAIQSFRAAIEDRQGSSALYINMAIAYLYLQRPKKALKCLKQAVILEPLNEKAVMLFADLAFSERCMDDSVQILKYFLEFEQKKPLIWARLARVYLFLGNIKEAIAALKRQGSIEDSSAVWNNLGVAYIEQGDHQKAYEALSHAMLKDTPNQGKDYFLAARNICHLLAIKREFKELLKFSSIILRDENKKNLLFIKTDRVLSDIIAFNLHSLWKLNKKNEFIQLSKDILEDADVAHRLRAWIITILIGHLALLEDGLSEAKALSEKFDFLIDTLGKLDSDRKEQLINNVAYIYVEEGLFEKAEKYLRYLTSKIYIEPYPTATFGLLSFRKGNFERGEQLYLIAISLAKNREDKTRIRQKLNFELAKIWIEKDSKKAKRFLNSVIEHKDGSEELANMATRLKDRLLIS